MNKLTSVSVVSAAESALYKLKKGGICVYSCKKRGAEFIFSIKDKDIKKVFAIFAKPCYNIRIVRYGTLRRLADLALLRVGLIVGATIFVALAALSDAFILKIEVAGSGSYLSEEVRRIVLDEGAGEFKRFSAFDGAAATGRILSLPNVTFCNVERRGSVLVVDVQVDGEHDFSASSGDLLSDREGVVKSIVAICGTAAVKAGDSVRRGTPLIIARTEAGEKSISVPAVGYCEIESSHTSEYVADCESEENLAAALASTAIDGERVIGRSWRVEPCDGGVRYIIECKVVHRLSINLT